MVEQTHAGEGHDHVFLVARFDDQIVTDGAAGLGDILDTGCKGPLDIIAEGEEGSTLPTAAEVGEPYLKEVAQAMPVAAFSSLTSCQEFSASIRKRLSLAFFSKTS